MSPLQSIFDLAQLEGEIAFGARAADADMIQKKLSVTSKAWCAVNSWIVIKVEGAPDAAHVPPMQPLVLWGQTVVAENEDLMNSTDGVFSTYATGYGEGPIFETPSHVYVLMGWGRLIWADVKLVQAAQSFLARKSLD